MKLLVYEFVTGGGFLSWPAAPPPSGTLLAEGAAMLDALLCDLQPAHELVVLRDARLPTVSIPDVVTHVIEDDGQERRQLERLAGEVDGVLLIAPELHDSLRMRAQWIVESGGELFSPAPEFIAVAADKRRCCDRLANAGVATPLSFDDLALPTPADTGEAWISKPNDGCGSHDIHVLHSSHEARAAVSHGRRVERVVQGWPLSVGVLCGPAGNMALEPCEQHLNTSLGYVGGRVPLSRPELAVAAQQVALQAVAAIGQARGFVGVDLVVGKSATVVEVNPRLTTSYVGLSQWYDGRLGEAMLSVARGHSVSLRGEGPPIEFTATGLCTRLG